MAHRVCPWWLGYVLASRLRRLMYDSAAILKPYVHDGMTVLEPGPGMGFFTLELARLVGPTGRVIAVDVQPRMVAGLKRRLAKAGLAERVDARLASEDSMGIADLVGQVDFALAMAVVHEMPSARRLFTESAAAMRPGATMLFAEPSGHVSAETFAAEVLAATEAGFVIAEKPMLRLSQATLLKKA